MTEMPLETVCNKLSLSYGAAHFEIKDDPRAVQKITARIDECRKQFPVMAEFTMKLRGVWYFGTYHTLKSGVCQVSMLPQDVADEILRADGLTAIPGQ